MINRTLIIAFIIFSSVLSEAHASLLLDRVVAVVNQEVITWSELYRAMETDIGTQIRNASDEERQKIYRQNEAAVLDSLINMKALLQEARQLGFGVSEREVDEAVDSIRTKYSMKEDEFISTLKKEGYSPADYRTKLREQILAGKILNQQIRNKIIVSEDEIDRFIEANRSSIDPGEGYRISQILLKIPKSEPDRVKIEVRAAEVMQKLKGGAHFADIARQYSEDASASMGGDLGFIKKGYLMKEFLDALAGLKPGDVSPPFWTERGLHIIRLEERVAGKDRNEIAEEARRQITNRLFMERYEAYVKSLRAKALVDIRL